MSAAQYPAELLGQAPKLALSSVWRSVAAVVNSANLAAGLTAGLFYTFGAIPLYLDAAAKLGLSPDARSSWFFIIFFTSGASSIVLSLRYRQPLPLGFTVPGLVFLAAFRGQFTVPEMAGAGLATGVVLLALGVLGLGERAVRLLPLPIVMGVFVGSVLGYVSGIFGHLATQPWTVGAAIAGYLGARALGRTWLPPMGSAVLAGLAAAAAGGQVHPENLVWSAPQVEPVAPVFSLTSLLALTVPLVLITLGIGGVQGIGVLESQGYRPPTRVLTVMLGVNSIVNALFGGHPSTMQTNGTAILAGQDAGPRDQRYVACLLASIYGVALALCASAAGSLLSVLPASLVASLAGLAIISAVMEALRKTVVTDLPVGAFFALVIAASPLTILGIGSAFWALVGGLGVSLLLERPALRTRRPTAEQGRPVDQSTTAAESTHQPAAGREAVRPVPSGHGLAPGTPTAEGNVRVHEPRAVSPAAASEKDAKQRRATWYTLSRHADGAGRVTARL